jgi:23S rRNA pseudouridine1911/1915/1917 synthase
MTEKIHLEFCIPEELAGKRLDQAVATLAPTYSRATLQKWITQGWLQLDGRVETLVRFKVAGQETVVIDAELSPVLAWVAQDIALNIVYEDEDVLVINKPAGLVVHPAVGNKDKTLVNALLHHVPGLSNIPRAGIVHRLDKETSGLLVVAKTLAAHTSLVRQLQARTMGRIYQAFVTKVLIAGGKVDAPLGRHPHARTKMAVVKEGKHAVTHYRIKKRFPAHTWLECRLETGRTHQIRVHLAHIAHPLIGDPVYGGRLQVPPKASPELVLVLKMLKRQALHASHLAFLHPTTGETLAFDAPLPADLERLLAALQADSTRE